MTDAPLPPPAGYLTRVAISLDEFINVLCWGNLDETISARAGRAAFNGKLWGIVLAGILSVFFPNHCRKAEEHDWQRAVYIAWLEAQNNPESRLTLRLMGH